MNLFPESEIPFNLVAELEADRQARETRRERSEAKKQEADERARLAAQDQNQTKLFQ